MRYYFLPGLEVFRLYRLDKYREKLQDYLKTRDDVLDTPAILSETALSRNLTRKDFSLFERVDTPEPGAFIVLGLYLELLEYWGEGEIMMRILADMSRQYPTHICLAFYNHDHDFAKYNTRIPHNVRILNCGYTSSRTPNDILIPFWTIEENPHTEPKTQFASFIGTPNNSFRAAFMDAIRSYDHPDIQTKQIHGDEYLRELSRTTFTLCPRGGLQEIGCPHYSSPVSTQCEHPSHPGGFSYRVFEAIQARSIPVLFVDKIQYPMTDVLDWDAISIRFPEVLTKDIAEVHRRLKAIDPAPYLAALESAREQLSLLGVQQYIVSHLNA